MVSANARAQVVNVGVSCFYNPNVDPATGKQSTVELLAPNHCIPPLDGNRLKVRRRVASTSAARHMQETARAHVLFARSRPAIPAYASLQRLAFQLACEDVDSKAVEIARYNRYFSDITGAGLVSKVRSREAAVCQRARRASRPVHALAEGLTTPLFP